MLHLNKKSYIYKMKFHLSWREITTSNVSDLRQVDGFFPGTLDFSSNKTVRRNTVEISLKVALNTITSVPPPKTASKIEF